MQETTPEIYLIARPSLDWGAVSRYLDSVGGQRWRDERKPPGHLGADHLIGGYDAQTLIEFMGRLCYRSWEPGLNMNVTKVREDQNDYLENIIGVGHGSVLEHASYSFVFADVSRVFTHELVRHRAGVAISQESMRFVRLDNLKVWMPEALRNPPRHHAQFIDPDGHRPPQSPTHDRFLESFVSIVENLEEWQREAAEHYGLDDEGTPFAYKKYVTSALRRLAPIGTATSIGWTANVRTLRHVIEMRTSASAEEEIRLVFDEVARLMRAECPALFGDYERNDDGEWVPGTRKV